MSLERFRKVWAQLPETERKLPIVIVRGEPVSWEKTFEEILKKSEVGEEIQKILEEKGFI